MEGENEDTMSSTRERTMEEMLEYTKSKFPRLQTNIYFVPDQFFHKAKYTRMEERSVASHQVVLQDETQHGDFSSDRAEYNVMLCLRHITSRLQPQPMVVLSDYYMGDFLYEAVKITNESTGSVPLQEKKVKTIDILFPNLGCLVQGLKDAEIDILVLSQKFGVVVIEIKAFGFSDRAGKDDHGEGNSQPSDGSDRKLKDTVQKAVEQLSKCEQVLRVVLAKFPGTVPIRKCVALPFIRRSKVQALIEGDPGVTNVLSQTFETASPEDTLAHFLCADDVAAVEEDEDKESERVAKETLAEEDSLLAWWENLTKRGNLSKSRSGDFPCEGSEDCVMSTDDFEELVSMFCGPYSKLTIDRGKPLKKKSQRRAPKTPFTEQVRTAADCIHLTGLRFGRSILRPDQVEILDSPDPFVFLAGPPGSGKTLLLGLKAEKWAKDNCNVVIVSATGIGWGSLVSLTLYSQVVKDLTPQEDKKHASSKKKSAKTKPIKSGQSSKSADPSASKTATTSEIHSTKSLAAEADHCQTSADVKSGVVAELVSNIRYVEFSKSTDSLSFVQDLFEKCEGRPLRLIIDECPIKVNASRLHNQLDGVHRRLGDAKSKLQSLHTTEEGAKASEGTETKPVDRREEGGAGGREGNEGEADSVVKKSGKEYASKIRHHLSVIIERLLVLQPENQRPQVTQTQEWKGRISMIETICKEIQTLLLKTETSLPASCLSATKEGQLLGASPALSTDPQKMRNPDDVEENPCIKALKDAEALALDASGLLFNVETAMDFFVIDEVLVSLATQHKDRDVQVWASGIYQSYQPNGFVKRQLKRSLRCSPKIQEVLEHVEKDIYPRPGFAYQCSSFTAEDLFLLPTPGPDVKLLPHGGHVAKEIADCSACGEALADYLQTCLSQGEGLGLEDVIIAGSFDIGGYDCKLTQTLVQRKIPLQYMEEDADVNDPPPYPGKAFVIGGSPLQGLEAKIVVFLPDVTRIPATTTDDPKQFREGLPDWLKNMGRWNRCHLWFVASRCLSQLVVFSV